MFLRARTPSVVRRLLVLTALAGAACEDTEFEEPATASTPIDLSIERYRLGNGLEVILHEDHAVPLVYTGVRYHVGARDDLPGKSGLAHLAEHMMFEGSQHVPAGDYFRILGGAGNADANAFTSMDVTDYHETVPSNQLETALWLESDRMSFLRPALDPARFEAQRDVVRNERRQRLENVPFGADAEAAADALYRTDDPRHDLVIGTHADLQGETLADVDALFATWYGPGNATLVIAGDFDPAATHGLVEKWFGTLPASPIRPPHRALPPVALGRTSVQRNLRDPLTKVTRIHYVWPSARYLTDDDGALDILALVLAQRPVGRLWMSLGRVTGLQNIAAYQASADDGGEFHIAIDLAGGTTTTVPTLPTIMELATDKPPSPEEIQRARAAMETTLVTRLESLAGRGAWLQELNHVTGDPDGIAWLRGRWRAATSDVVKNLAAGLVRAARVTIVTEPAAPETP
jgi:zinc protease